MHDTMWGAAFYLSLADLFFTQCIAMDNWSHLTRLDACISFHSADLCWLFHLRDLHSCNLRMNFSNSATKQPHLSVGFEDGREPLKKQEMLELSIIFVPPIPCYDPFWNYPSHFRNHRLEELETSVPSELRQFHQDFFHLFSVEWRATREPKIKNNTNRVDPIGSMAYLASFVCFFTGKCRWTYYTLSVWV